MKTRIGKQWSPALLMVSAAGLAPSSGMAEEELMLEEVIVTATRQESALMETPVAVTSFDANTRDELGIDTPFDLAVHTPSFTYVPSRVAIRGVGRPNISLGTDPGVGIYWDGVYSSETDLFSFSNFLDIERVEVLRGPQGTLYGRNTIGGAVNFISARPDTEEWGGKVLAELGNYDYYVLQGLASGPVTKKLSALVALSRIQRGGLQENEGTSKRFDQEGSTYGTIDLHHQSTDNWSNSLKLYSRKSDIRRRQPYILNAYSTEFIQEVQDVTTGEQLNFPGLFPGQNFANGQQGMTRQNPALDDENAVSVDYDPSEENNRWGGSFISEYDADTFTVKYTGGYSDFEYNEDYDADGIKASESGLDWSQLNLTIAPGVSLPVSALNGGYTLTPAFTTRPFYQENKSQSHELQFFSDFGGSVNFTAGLYYYNSKEEQGLAFIEHNDQLMATYALFGSFINGPVSDENYIFRSQNELETTSYAAYGQMNWDITQSTVLNFGLRYTYDKKDGSDSTFAQYVGDLDDPTVNRSIKDSWDKVTWRIGVDQFLGENHFLYGFVATGYRSGGFNLGAPTESSNVDTVDPENILSYEVGYKGGLLDNRLNLASAVYYYDYTDLQVLKTDLVNGVAVPVFENAADANAYGLEAELTALLTQSLTLSGTYSYNKTEYKDYQSIDSNACALGPLANGFSQAPLCTQAQDLKGNQFGQSPEHQASANLIYFWEWFAVDWRATLSYQYMGKAYTTAFNNEQYDELDSWDRWDARLSVLSQQATWEVTAYVKNIADERREFTRGRPSTVSHLTESRLTDPRVFGVRLSYNF